MRIVPNKFGGFYVETQRNVEVVEEQDGQKTFLFILPKMEEIIPLLPSPLIEEIFSVANMTLQERDRKMIEESL
jgi:hypothetical protein